MKARTLSLLVGLGGSLLLGSGAEAAFTGISVQARSGTTAGTDTNPPGVTVFVCNVFANYDNPNDRLNAVAGTPSSPMFIEVVGGTFFQASGVGSGDFAPTTATIIANADVMFDSFITIDGKLFGSAPYGGEFSTDALLTTPAWPGFNASTLGPSAADPLGQAISWFIPPGNPLQGLSDTGQGAGLNGVAGGVLLGQFSTSNGTAIQGSFVIQYDSVNGGPGQLATVSFLHEIPEPGVLALLGVAGLVGRRRRRS